MQFMVSGKLLPESMENWCYSHMDTVLNGIKSQWSTEIESDWYFCLTEQT